MNKDGRTAMLMILIQPTTAAWSHESENQCAVCAYINVLALRVALVLSSSAQDWEMEAFCQEPLNKG